MRLAAWFDSWVNRGPFTAVDLARFRIVFGIGALLTLFDFSWFTHFPASMYIPPPGPFQLLPGFPPLAVGLAIEIGIALSFASLAFGYRTRFSGWSASILMVLGFGFTYSLGKIDHPILFAIAPAVLSFTGWGDELSIDKLRGRTRGIQQWPLRLLAFMIGIAFFTAGFAKLRANWLSPETQAARRQFLSSYVDGNSGGILPWVVDLDVPILWELLDWATVIMELGLVVCVLSWTAFRIGIALATIFHFGVFFLLSISFGFNVLVYGAFVEWSRVPVRAPAALVRFFRRWYPLLIPLIALAMWAWTHFYPQTAEQSGWLTVLGGGVASAYLIVLIGRGVRRGLWRVRPRRVLRSAPR